MKHELILDFPFSTHTQRITLGGVLDDRINILEAVNMSLELEYQHPKTGIGKTFKIEIERFVSVEGKTIGKVKKESANLIEAFIESDGLV